MDCQWTSSSCYEHFCTTAHVPPNKLKVFLAYTWTVNTTLNSVAACIIMCICFAFLGIFPHQRRRETRATCGFETNRTHISFHTSKQILWKSCTHTFLCATDWFTFSNEQTCSSDCMEFFIDFPHWNVICFDLSWKWTNI